MPLVVTSEKTHILPILATNKMENPFFNGNSKNPSYESCWQWKYAHHCQKWGQDSKFCYKLAQTKLNWVESQVKSSLAAFFVKSFSMKIWYAMISIFF
jgi:hypothetical protein